MALVPVDPMTGALVLPTGIANFGTKQKPRDFQRTTELICKFIVDTTQMMNRLSAHCDEKLQKVSRDLQRFEVQLRLLEYKLDSIDEEEGRMVQSAEDRKAAREAKAAEREEQAAAAAESGGGGGGGGAGGAGGGGAGAARGAIGAPPGTRLAIGAPPGTKGAGSNVPAMPQRGGYTPGNVPVPGAPGAGGKSVPLPPGVTAAGKGVVAAPPPPPPPPMTKIVAAPPPFPVTAGLSTRKHPKLKGYFDMVDAGVPAAAVRARMASDGYKPEWLDQPDAKSPLPAMSQAEQKTFYDSD
jgi:hypothetical protein